MDFGRLIAASSLCALLAAALPAELVSQSEQPAPSPKTFRYHPKQRVPPSLESVLKHLVPGSDAFPDEKEAEEIGDPSRTTGRVAARSARIGRLAIMDDLLAREFKGGRLLPSEESPVGNSPQLEIFRSSGISTARREIARRFAMR